jgi:signal transduction histidine kinase
MNAGIIVFGCIHAMVIILGLLTIDDTNQLLLQSETRAREASENANEVKDEFLSMASHQLRTPLTSIKGYLSMILEGDVGKISADQRHLLTEVYQSSNNMVRLVGDLLNVSRIQAGKFVIEKVPVDLAQIVQEEASIMANNVLAQGFKIDVRIGNGDYKTNIDDLKVRQIINNLIDNALHYSKQDGHINVRLKRQGGKMVFSVTDQGIGVPKEMLPKLFTKFIRAGNARRQRPDGTGIGLFLVKKVAKAHGGDVFVESVEGKGSTFGFWLPR